MKRSRRGIVQFFKGNSLGKNVVLVTLSLLLFAGLCVLLILDFKNDNFNEIWRAIIGTIIGIFISLIAMFLLRTFLGYFEDELKVNKNTQEMLEIYPKDRYRKKIKISEQGDAKTFIYNEVFINNGQMAIEFIDHHNQHFVLNDFFESHFDVLLAAHGSSVIKNSLTIRLADVEIHEDENKAIFHFSRSNYYNHLVTNRAVDYLITSAITPRKLYAYGPYIPPLKDSPFSNHIGINALVFTSDGYLIFPKRGRKATISKGQITSSIAIRLLFKNDGTPFYQQNFSGQAGKDYILHDFLIRQLDERLYFDLEKLKAD
ncbi:MAG: hypothetical protein ACOX3K_05435 [Bacilli bacterium]|jgi:hypothetical protein